MIDLPVQDGEALNEARRAPVSVAPAWFYFIAGMSPATFSAASSSSAGT